MKSLKESNDILDRPAALADRFASDGYIFLRSFFERATIEKAHQTILETFSRHPDPNWENAVSGIDTDGTPVADSLQHFFRWPGFRAASDLSEFHRLPYTAPLRTLTQDLLGGPAFCIPWGHLRVAPPVAQATMSGRHVHHDFNFWNVNDMITTWIPLMPIPVPLGGLAILPGSQLGEPTDDHMLGADEQDFATADYEPGDTVLFHCLTAHGVLPNTQDTYRMSGDFRWQRKNEAVRERLLFGPDGRRFQRHAELFSDEPWWQPVPEDAVVIPHRTRSRVQPASALFKVNSAWNPSRVFAGQNAYAGPPRDDL